MANGGLATMMYSLLDRPLGDWHPRRVIRTSALAAQQIESLSPLDQWWLTVLESGVLGGGGAFPNEAVSNEFEEEAVVGKDSWGAEIKRLVKRPGLYDLARRSSPKLKAVSDTALGKYLRNIGQNGWIIRKRGWRFPSLAECRDQWLERFPATVWPSPSPEDWTFGEDDNP
jgi:hypothetical protein